MTGPSPRRPVRLLFLAWGRSVHAERRIRPFVGDARFEVAVASTHDYAFEGARNILLDGRPPDGAEPAGAPRTVSRRIRGRIRHELVGALHRFLARRDPDTTRQDAERWFHDRDRLLRAAAGFRPDVVFLQTLLYPCYLAFFLPRSVPVVVTFWNGDLLWWAKWNGIERRFKKWIVGYGIRRAKAVTVNSEGALRACLAHGGRADRIHRLPWPGVDRSRFRPRPKDEDRRALGISAGKVVLCPRGTEEYLNGDVVVAALGIVAREIPGVLFLFLSPSGNPEEFEPHARRLREAGLGDRFRLEGRVPWESMPAYYGAADAVVSVSSNDSLPNCMLEAMACGVPVVMGDIPAIREWVEDGVNGLLVPPRDPAALAAALLRLLGGEGERLAPAFAAANEARVRKEADSVRNVERAKEIVLAAAGVK